ncbi:hypothetical protein Dsin_011067 [Dipteronia sinensis]|uniref:DC1 domain-containing protein n=1 Tax=Dipteronia sinensis TaxID=43782 RepID=A0AAE0ATX9_9ROSI|nr:hypothetical protein Dsin_011067 [Dipteronia sinensis]
MFRLQELKASGWIYTCNYCNYFLHISCSKLPQQITHPFDHQNHVLSLLPKPTYSQGLFNCDACGKQGNGFSYHCGTCNIDLHTICATMPLLLSFDPTNLTLTFSTSHSHPLIITKSFLVTYARIWVLMSGCTDATFVNLMLTWSVPQRRQNLQFNQLIR